MGFLIQCYCQGDEALRTGLQTWDTNRNGWKKRKATSSSWQSSSAAGFIWHDQKEGRLGIFLHCNPCNGVSGKVTLKVILYLDVQGPGGFECEHSVVSTSFTKNSLLLLSCPRATNYEVSPTKTCHSRWARTLPAAVERAVLPHSLPAKSLTYCLQLLFQIRAFLSLSLLSLG